MPRRDLHVPFEEKHEVKKIGARWDPSGRRWYVPDGLSDEPFSRWFEPRSEAPMVPPDFTGIELNLNIAEPAIVEATIGCWSCHVQTPVLTVAGRDDDGDLEAITGIKAFDSELGAALAAHSYYRLAFSRTTRLWAYGNVCVGCGALQGDFFLYSEPDSPFFALHSPDNDSKVTDLAGSVRVATDYEPYRDLT